MKMGKTLCHFLFIFTLQICFPGLQANLKFYEEKIVHVPRNFNNSQISNLASLYDEVYFDYVLKKIMVPRVVGTPSHENVKKFIVGELKTAGWSVEEDRFSDTTPNFGELVFTNIIGRLNPSASRYLVLACHYDSKYFPTGRFVGATDSAVPCAMMLHMAHALKEHIQFTKQSDLSLMFIFFDGEEAFHRWSDTDSLYGARNLAAKWEKSAFPLPHSLTNELDRIDVLVLLDLIGEARPKFYSYFQETSRWHSLLSNIERRLKSIGLIPAAQPLHFIEKSSYSGIQDDHVPFLVRNVPVLHVIPNPFPRVWHTMDDNYTALDFPTIRTVTSTLQVFVLSYLSGETPH